MSYAQLVAGASTIQISPARLSVASGLSAIITTPAHGTAFDIAGKGVADPGAMREAFRIACEMAMSR